MTTQAKRRTRFGSILIIAFAIVFLIAVLSVSFAFRSTLTAEAVDYATLSYEEITEGLLTTFTGLSGSQMAEKVPEDGIVDTADEFMYIFFSGNAMTYQLTKNFKISALSWSEKNPIIPQGAVLNGNNCTIWANQINTSPLTPNNVGGLAGENSGTIMNLNYYYSGGLYNSYKSGSRDIRTGGMIGSNLGTINHCTIDCGGSVLSAPNSGDVDNDMYSYAGGVIGTHSGILSNCTIVSSVNVTAQNSLTDNTKKHNVIYAGGVIGNILGGTVTSSTIKSEAAVTACDITDTWDNNSTFFSTKTAYNDSKHVHPAGVVFGAINNAAKVTSCNVECLGSAISFGLVGSNNEGSVAGSFIGMVEPNCAGAALTGNFVRIKSMTSAFFLKVNDPLSMSGVADELLSGRWDRIRFFSGGFVGKSRTSKGLSIANNVIYIDGDNGIVEDGVDFDNEFDAFAGLFCGNSDLDGLIGTNNWLVRRLAECNTDRESRNTMLTSRMNHLNIFGSGGITATPTSSGTSITINAKEDTSPFYGWTSEPWSATPTFTKTKNYTLSGKSGTTLYAMFVDTDIRSGGELTQFAYDVNLIKEDVWAQLGTSNSDHRAYFSGAQGVTLSWLDVKVGNDFTVSSGTPVIEEFRGKFNGQGHTITFAAGSEISHDYEKKPDNNNDDDPYYSEYNTGLFGENYGTITNINIRFGASIMETSGVEYKGNADDLPNKKVTYGDESEISNNVYTYQNFDAQKSTILSPDSLDANSCYVYFFTGNDFDWTRGTKNPGYVEVVPYKTKCIVVTGNVGALVGKNVGTISYVDLEISKSAYILGAAANSNVGGLIGLNIGYFNNVNVTVRGKLNARAKYMANVGGIAGQNKLSTSFENVSAYIAGEINVEHIATYHKASYYLYEKVEAKHGSFDMDEDNLIGGKLQNYQNSAPKYTYAIFAENQLGTKTEKIFGAEKPDPSSGITEKFGGDSLIMHYPAELFGEQSVGVIFGRNAYACSLVNASGSCGIKGEFNTDTIHCDSTYNVYVGALVGKVQDNALVTFQNAWAVMPYEEYLKEDNGRAIVGNKAGDSSNSSASRAYVQTTIAVGRPTDGNIVFSLESKEGVTFSGWYEIKNGVRKMETNGLDGNEFTPPNQNESGKLFIVEVVPLQIFEKADLMKIALSTNEGRTYEGVEFSLGTNIVLDSNYTPIGTEANPFLGSLNGNGLTVRLNNVSSSATLAGLFGCVGAQGVVKNITVWVESATGAASVQAAGAVAAINCGTIGQDSASAKVYVKLTAQLTGKIVGGAVGENRNLLQNTEVLFTNNGTNYGRLHSLSPDIGDEGIAGGAVGYNKKTDATPVVKNVIVNFYLDAGTMGLVSSQRKYALGGVIGRNGAETAAYSVVSIVSAGYFMNGMNGSDGDNGKYRGYIIGYNESVHTDALWCLYRSISAEGNSKTDPAFGNPLSVYREKGDSAPTVSNAAVLMSGTNYDKANILIQYGKGEISVSIVKYVASTGALGGQIRFNSAKYADSSILKADDPDFYDYVASFETGELVTVTDGNTGTVFSPAVGLSGKVFYAGFQNNMISNASDYNYVANKINKDYRLYVRYQIINSFKLDASSSATAIGKDVTHPFLGSLNGNGFTVTLDSDSDMHAIVNVLGEKDKTPYAEIKNLKVLVQSGSRTVSTATDANRGFLTYDNYGTISGITMTVRGYISNEKGNGGAIAGLNRGIIESSNVTFDFANYLGTEGRGAILGKYVGGIAGINEGVIGSKTASAVFVSILTTNGQQGALYGSTAAGGIAGLNRENGIIRSAIVTVKGVLAGGAVGGVTGINQATIEDAIVSVEKGSIYFATNSFGGISGENEGAIGNVRDDFDEVVKAYVSESPSYGSAYAIPVAGTFSYTTAARKTKNFGVIVGVNKANGQIFSCLAELSASSYAENSAGLLAGQNSGGISYSTAESTNGSALSAKFAGGAVGDHSGSLVDVLVTIRGNVGSSAEGANGIVKTTHAGGFAGRSTGFVSNSAVTCYADFYGDATGLGAATAPSGSATNSWIQISNATATPTSGSEDTGFNAIRVMNDTLLRVTLNYTVNLFTFRSMINGVKGWYTDISAWDDNDEGVLTEGLVNTSTYSPKSSVQNLNIHLSYTELRITSASGLINLSNLINSRDYYRGVLFVLDNDVQINRNGILRPIGSAEHPFNAIFDGGYHKITFASGSAISGTEYTGLFGYTSASSVVRNFILDIEEGVTIGGVNSFEIGALAGRSLGEVKNVFVNLSSGLVYNSQARYAGSFAGYVSGGNAINTWISVLNGKDKIVGNGTETEFFGVNNIGVLGFGLTKVSFLSSYDRDTDQDIRVKYYVPNGEGGNATYKRTCEAYFEGFGGWYSDIRSGEFAIAIPNYEAIIGELTYNADDLDVSLSTAYNVSNVRVILSFINLSIADEKDFVRFASDINTYGDQGAKFTLLNDITVDFSQCESVGSAERPFTGLFEGNGHVLSVVGSMIKRDYAGVFGYVGRGGTVRNVHIKVIGENVKIGDNSTLYAGIGVALLRGELRNVVVSARADTVVFTTQGLPSSGGIAGRAEDGYSINNAWLVLAENATVLNPVGLDTYYIENRATKGEGRVMQQVGVGSLMIEIESDGTKITFDSTEVDEDGRDGFYGYIDNNNVTDEVVTPIHDGGAGSSIYVWTVKPGDSVSNDMLAVFINKYVSSLDDLERVSQNVRLGRNYRGITYELTADVTLSAEGFEPIGGEVVTGSGTSFLNYVERDFIGGFDGKGHTITMPEGLVIGARYAGLFGRVGESARIKNLTIHCKSRLGVDTGVNTTRTIYAGVLAAYALGGSYQNNVIILDKLSSLYGSVGTGRTFGYLPRSAGNVASNCWVVSYNSKANYELNAEEIKFNRSFVSASSYADEGANQGGVNNIMVVAAGQVGVIRQQNDASSFHFTYGGTSYWYPLNEFSGDRAAAIGATGGQYSPDKTLTREGFNVSFLNSEISTLQGLKEYAKNVNDGYDFYKLTFTLTRDLVIGEGDGFEAIGNERSGMNGVFDGQGHSILLSSGAVIGGKYAGIFGYVKEDGTIRNLRIAIEGALGNNDYTSTQVEMGAVNTLFAGAIAYNNGQIENVIVISSGASLRTLNGVSGLVIGYDNTNLVRNVWGLIDASDLVLAVGEAGTGDTSVNTMKIVGIGTMDASFSDVAHGDYRVKFVSTSAVPVMGWFKSFEKSLQISEAMLSGGELRNGDAGYLVAPIGEAAARYEVAVIKTTIENAEELIAVAEDVNVGGYSFETLIFTLGADIEIPSITTGRYVSIGTEKYPFKGTFSGKLGNEYHSITIRENYSINGIFGNNAGEIRDLIVRVSGTVGEVTSSSDHIYGTVAAVNNGVITGTFVEIKETGKVVGYTAGGVVGRNNGTLKDSVVVVKGTILAESREGNTISAGALAGINYGTIEGSENFEEWISRGLLPKAARYAKEGNAFVLRQYDLEANAFLYGKVSALSGAQGGVANAGGAIGNNYQGSASYLITYVMKGGLVEANSLTKDGARAGGLVGYTHSSVNHNVVFLFGDVLSPSLAGGTAGYLDGVTAMNVWQVTDNRVVEAAGAGAKSVNTLNVKGNGTVKASIDTTAKSVLFTNMTDDNGSKLDGWYLSSGIQVDAATGNVGENENTFLPKSNVQNKYVMVVFVNTEIRTAQDLADMASSVSSGLSGEDIVFKLMNDLTLFAGDLTENVGSENYPFNNVFDGQGYTLTVNDGAIPGSEYRGIFGYTGGASLIENLNVVVKEGSYGSERSLHTGILSAYAQGSIKNVSVTLETNANLMGQAVGTIAGYSLGAVENVSVRLEGSIKAFGSSNTNVAGGVIGVNNGSLEKVALEILSGASIGAEGSAMAYVGGIVGENYTGIARATVAYAGQISVAASMSPYAGVGVGLNLGYLDKCYIEVLGGTIEGGVSGGFIGNNVNALTDSLIKIVNGSLGGRDSAVGASLVRDESKVNNVWVYTDSLSEISNCDLINNMTFEEGLLLSCPTAADVLAGKISFTASVSDLTDSFAIFAEIRDGEAKVGSGAHVKNAVYDGSDLSYVTFDEDSDVVTSRRVSGVSAMLSLRKAIGSGMELAAFSSAVNGGAYAFHNAVFTIASDFALPANELLPDGYFRAIGSGEALSSSVTIEGWHHVITVGDTTLTGGLFGTTAAAIRNIGLRLTKEEENACFAMKNDGSIRNAVVYLEEGAEVSGALFQRDGSGSADNLFVVTRVDYALGVGSKEYAVIRINGVGSVVQGGNDAMMFSAETDGTMIFIGWTRNGSIFSSDPSFASSNCEKDLYTAEFVSTLIDTTYKLTVLSDAAALGYTGEGVTFTLGADVTAPAPLSGFKTNAFKGVLDGNGYSLIFESGFTDSALGLFAGTIKNVRMDLSNLASGVKIFEGTAKVNLENVVFVENRSVLSVGAPVSAKNVYFETSNASLYEAFKSIAAYRESYSIIYGNGLGSIAYSFGDSIGATAADTESQVFAGWFGELGTVHGSVFREKRLELSSQSGNGYMLNYVNRTLSSANDLDRLSTAVLGAFDFDGITFRVADGGFTVSSSLMTIGSETHPFKGSIEGGINSVIRFAADTAPLIHTLYGALKDVAFEFESGCIVKGASPCLVRINRGLMSGVVVLASSADPTFDGGSALCGINGGEMRNCWLVTGSKESAVGEGSLIGVNEIRADLNTFVSVTYQKTGVGTRVSFEFMPLVGHFVCLYDYEGNVVFPGAYNYGTGFYTSPESASGQKFEVRSIRSIAKEDELVYLGYLTAEGALAEGSVISLAGDLTVRRNLTPIYFDGIVLDLAGYSLTINSMGDGNLFTARSEDGTFRNGVVYLKKGYNGLSVAGAKLENIVLSLSDSGMILPAYSVKGAIVMTFDQAYKTSLTAEAGDYGFVYYEKGAILNASFSNGTPVFTGSDNDAFYFSAIVSLSETEKEAVYAPSSVNDQTDFNKLARANEVSPNHLAGSSITITSDFAADGNTLLPLLSFRGAISGDRTITITGGSFPSGIITLGEGGSINGVALALKGVSLSSSAVLGENISRVAVIAYHGALSETHEEEKSAYLNVYGEGTISVQFGETLRYEATTLGNYALRAWKNSSDAEVNQDENGDPLSIYEGSEPVSAYFALRYLVSVRYIGVSEDEIKNESANMPSFSGLGVYFADELEATGNKIEVKVKNIGSGYMFWGLGATTAFETVSKDASDAWKYSISWTAGHYDIVLTAELSSIPMEWVSETYRASAIASSTDSLSAITSRAESLGYSVVYSYSPLGATPPLVGGLPYHAGNYLISYRVHAGSRQLCDAFSGLEILPAELTFKSLAIKDKVYDGTTRAELLPGSMIIDGFKGNDETFVSVSGIVFSFKDANAEQGKLVYVSGDAKLVYDPEFDESGANQFAYLDYVFDGGSISSAQEGLIRANIERATLELEVSSIEVDYLAQFEGAAVFYPTVKSGLLEKDRAAYEAVASTLMTRERSNEFDAGAYRIIVGDNLALPNYNVVMTGKEAYYIVRPTEVKIFFDLDEIEYGSSSFRPKYHVCDGTECSSGCSHKGMREGDELYFDSIVYNAGGTLLPSEERYDLVCLFSDRNKNYVVSASDGYEIEGGSAKAILKAENVLRVTPKKLYVVADEDRNVKFFGKRNETIYASLSQGNSFVERSHKLVLSREEGESVGRYALRYGVTDANGEDISDRYEILSVKEGGYYYEIKKVAIRLKPGKTTVNYGTPVSSIKYSTIVGDGSITVSDLYFAMFGTEKKDATLSDVGVRAIVGFDSETILNVGEYDAVFSAELVSDEAIKCISGVTMQSGQRMVIVTKKYLTVTISDFTKTYNGVSDFRESLVSFKTEGLLEKDKSEIKVVSTGYDVQNAVTVGSYKINGTFALQATKTGDESLVNNYFIQVVSGNFIINPASVSIKAEVGYYDDQGSFTSASIERGDLEFFNTIYYGDNKAILRFTIEKGGAFINVPAGSSDKEASDAIASALKISYNKLSKLVPSDGKKTIDELGLISANNNVKATFTASVTVAPVSIIVRVVPSEKVIGEVDPGISYVLIAEDPYDDFKEIKNYFDLADGTFVVSITGDRTEGETLGSYHYSNVKIDVVNAYSGESLFDTSTDTGAAFKGNISKEGVSNAKLEIRQKSFIKTTIGKIVIYGGAVLLLAAGTVVAIILIPKARKKRKLSPKPKKPKKNKKKGEKDESEKESEKGAEEETKAEPEETGETVSEGESAGEGQAEEPSEAPSEAQNSAEDPENIADSLDGEEKEEQ